MVFLLQIQPPLVRCPQVTDPGVGNLLVPGCVHLAASPVVVSQHREPGLAVQAGALVDVFVDPERTVFGSQKGPKKWTFTLW